MPEVPQEAEQVHVPEAIERFVRQFLVTYKAAKLYPPASDIPRDSAADLIVMLQQLQRHRPDLRFSITKNAILFDGAPVLPGQRAFEAFAREFHHRDITEIRFHTGVAAHEVLFFFRALLEPPEAIALTGGFEQRLWDLQVDGITVRTLTARVFDAKGLDIWQHGDKELLLWKREEIDRLLDAPAGVTPREQRLLIRFMQDSSLLSRYLAEIANSGRFDHSLTNDLADRVTSLAHVASDEAEGDRPVLFRSIAEALLTLDAGSRRGVFEDRLLPDSRLDDVLALLVRQYELREICEVLIDGMDRDPVSCDGFSRALRNIIALNMQSRQEVLDTARAVMSDSGMEESLIKSVLENAAPTHIRISEWHTQTSGEAEDVQQLVDIDLLSIAIEDQQLIDLRREAAEGISDGDVLLRTIMLLTLENQEDGFAPLMDVVESGLKLLLQLGEYVHAADAVETLVALDGNSALTGAQHERIEAALVGMADADNMHEAVTATRRYEQGTAEHEAAHRLLTALGSRTITPLLEVLAEETDMTLRKNLVTIISSIASMHIDELGSRINDTRWYVVRNVVSILGATHSSRALTYLTRVLRHTDVRVRRETVRAIAGIRTQGVERALMEALADNDANNVALAARYLGKLQSEKAVGALTEVAYGNTQGSRDTTARIEAIEALGVIATPEAVEVLEDLTHQRGIIARSRMREIKTAAESALRAARRPRDAGGMR